MDEIFPVDEDDRDVLVTLTLDDDTELDCEIIVIFDVEDTGNSYIALLPVDENGDPLDENGNPAAEPEAILYRYREEADGSPVIDNIESEEEYELAAEIFAKIQDEEYDEE